MSLARLFTVACLGLFMFAAVSGSASAHQMTLSYVNILEANGKTTAVVKAPFLDLEVALGLDQNLDGKITWGEAKRGLNRIAAYVLGKTTFSAGGLCTVTRESAEPIEQSGEGYISLKVDVACPDPKAQVQVASFMFLEIDPTSRVLVSSRNGEASSSYVLGQKDQVGGAIAKPAAETPANGFLSYIVEGIGHLFGGPDHMLFLLVLIIPAIYAGNTLKAVAIAVLLPITGFTLGHALTLTSAASGLIRPPAQLVESLIAVTILLTAIDNVRPFIPGPRSVIAFAFGLIHGFGFASALGALDLSGWQMASALLGFNIGIETGQAVLALAVCPVLFLLRKPARRFHVMPLGVSALAGLMAVFWIAQRTGLI
jgi:hypothetical protein